MDRPAHKGLEAINVYWLANLERASEVLARFLRATLHDGVVLLVFVPK
jgi:hypothetical protein